MESIKEIFRIGRGPSSSHTMGPVRAAKIYRGRHPEAKSFRVTLYGSLALTGKDLPSLYKETSLGGLAAFGDKDFVES